MGVRVAWLETFAIKHRGTSSRVSGLYASDMLSSE
jgi:hypothetical protein